MQIPVATYRLQFHARFRLADACALVPYLDDLGITDAYTSPLFRSCEQSTHGYDVVDQRVIGPDIGTLDDFREFSEALIGRKMGLLMDVVPNHMGISDPNNRFWQDVLENGPSSPYADLFDIDWDPPKETLKKKVLLPVLGNQYGEVLENQELQLRFAAGRFFIEYHDHRYPLNLQSWPQVLELAQRRLAGTLAADDPHALELESIIIALRNLPPLDEQDPEKTRQCQLEREVVPRRLCQLLEANPPCREALGAAVTEFNGRRDDPRSFDRLEALLADQAYRLCHWRVAADEINYRRFFDINELAAIRVEDPRVFQITHRLVFQFVHEGRVTGLRVDHADGLFDPRQYFADLQNEFHRISQPYHRESVGEPQQAAADALYVVAEKILLNGETLPGSWAVQGTTGYDYLNLVNGLFVDRSAAEPLHSLYGRFTGNVGRFRDLAYESKRAILEVSMSSELHMLARRLERVAAQNRSSRDFTHASLRRALLETMACFPVYRTYIRPGNDPVDDDDRRRILFALRTARRRNPELNASLFGFLGSVLLLEHPEQLDAVQRQERREFVLRFQQLTGPVMAKGWEDTAFYRHYPLLSLVEVGGDPEKFGTTLERFHRLNAERLEHWPHSLLASSTHDTKRSEDVRARINVLSECAEAWGEAIARWERQNRRHKTELDGEPAPGHNEEYLLYQTLVGVWPLQPLDAGSQPGFVHRIRQFMNKAIKEAKLRTSWTNPDEEYEQAVARFVERILALDDENEFLADFACFHAPLAVAGMHNALAQLLLKIGSPGVPDFYQGSELWDFSLVDPDNRRPVDFALRTTILAELKARAQRERQSLAADVLRHWRDGRIKLYVTSQALSFRRLHRTLFTEGRYEPLTIDGEQAERLCAFARSSGGDCAIVVVPRLVLPLLAEGEPIWRRNAWRDTAIRLPSPARTCRNLFTGESHAVTAGPNGAAWVRVADVLGDFPVALLVPAA